MFLEEPAQTWTAYGILNQKFPHAAVQGLTHGMKSLKKLLNKLRVWWVLGRCGLYVRPWPGVWMHSSLGVTGLPSFRAPYDLSGA